MMTQKAKGLYAIRHAQMAVYSVATMQFSVVTDVKQIDKYPHWPCFARPCPIIPHPGFVDSRVVQGPSEAKVVWQETKMADPKGEMILMPVIPATHNAILAPGQITIGPGHDGATAGKDAVNVGVTTNPLFKDPTKVYNEAGITKAPHIELVRDPSGMMYAVQLRDAPVIPKVADFVPNTIDAVVEVVEPKGEDLMQWAERVKTFQPGTVVYHQGGALSSHYGLHCFENKIPYVTTHPVQVGELLLATAPQEEVSLRAVLDGISTAYNEMEIQYRDAVQVVLGGLHNRPFMSGESGRYLGAALMFCVRLGTLASFGEARHETISDVAREEVYKAVWANTAEGIQSINDARKHFHRKEGGGIGGPKWAQCAGATVNLWGILVKFMRKPSQELLSKAVQQLNYTINLAHNNGWWFNKFASQGDFDRAVNNPLEPVMQTIPDIYKIMTTKEWDEDLVDMVVERKGNRTKRIFKFANMTYKQGGLWTFNDGEKVWTHGTAMELCEAHGINISLLSAVIEKFENGFDFWIPKPMNQREIHNNENVGELLVSQKFEGPQAEPPKPLKILAAQCKPIDDNHIHIQFTAEDHNGYLKKDVEVAPGMVGAIIAKAPQVPSLAHTNTPYYRLDVEPEGVGFEGVIFIPLIDKVQNEPF